MRTIAQIERELAEAEAILRHGGIEQRDNGGNVVMTAQEHLATYARRARRLSGELEDLRAVFDQPVEIFYVTARVDSRRTALLLGPYNTQQEALDNVELASRTAREVWPSRGAAFWGFGTTRARQRAGRPAPIGQLHAHLTPTREEPS
jgi:hypothetical protein